MSNLSTLKIECHTAFGRDMKVSLDGVEVKGLQELILEMAVGETNTVNLVIAVDRVEVDAKTLAVLQAHVTKQVTKQ